MVKTRDFRILLVIMLLIISSMVAGCWGRRETQQMTLSTALGFDRIVVDGKPQFRLTVLSTQAPQGGGGAGQQGGGISEPQRGGNNQVLSITGDTIWDAGRNWNLRSSRRLFIGQVIVVVVGEETAQNGMGEIMDFLLRHQDVRERIWLVVCHGSAAAFLNAQPEDERILSIEIDGILKSAWPRTAKVKGIDLFNFTYALLTPGKEAVLPHITLFIPPEPSSPIRQNLAGSGSGKSSGTSDPNVQQGEQPQQQSFFATGFAVFQGNKMVGVMNQEESQGLLFLLNQVKTAALPIAFNGSVKNISLRLEGSKTKIEPVFNEKGIEFEVTIKANGNLMEESGDLVDITPEDWKKVEELAGRAIEKRCLDAVRKSQDLKSDVMGFGDKIHRTHPDKWKLYKDDWEEIFPIVTVNVQVEFKLKQTGVLSDPIKVQ